MKPALFHKEPPHMTRLVLAAAAISLGAVACGGASETGPGEYKADFKTNSLFFTNMSKPAASVHHGGSFQRTWYSTNIKDKLGQPDLPIDSVAIKETYPADGGTTPLKQFAMIKKGADSWYFERRNADGTLDPSLDGGINLSGCMTNCHEPLKAHDYLGSTAIKN
jgi:hypothetical protein